MANAQLVEYAKQQLAKGVSRDAVTKALKDVGWPDADIAAAVAEAGGPAVSTPAQPVSAQQPVRAVPVTQPQQPVQTAQTQPEARAAVAAADNIRSASSINFKVNEVSLGDAAAQPQKLNMVSAMPNMAAKKGGLPWGTIIFAILFVLSAGFAGYLYFQQGGSSAANSMEQLQVQGLTQQLATATQEKNDLAAQVQQLTQDKNDALAQLAAFVTPAPFSTSTTATPISAKGTLSGGDGRAFAVTTVQGVSFFVKNWRDKLADTALRPLLGSVVTVSGTHLPGARDITVDTVNDKPLSAPAITISATTTATTTVPAAQ